MSIVCADAFGIMAGMADGSVGSVITDPNEDCIVRAVPELLRISAGLVVVLDPIQAVGGPERPLVAQEVCSPADVVLFWHVVLADGAMGLGRIRIWRPCGPKTSRAIATVVSAAFQIDPGEMQIHPGSKPLTLMALLVSVFGKPPVFDPFAGYGSVGLACHRAGIEFSGVEINQRYRDLAAARCAGLVLA